MKHILNCIMWILLATVITKSEVSIELFDGILLIIAWLLSIYLSTD